MSDAFTGSNYYKHSFTKYEIEANERDAAKHAQNAFVPKWELTEYEIEACKRDVADAHTFTAATAMAAKIERRAQLDLEITALESEIAGVKQRNADALAVKDAEITALMVEIAAAKTKRNNKLAATDATISALEAELAAAKAGQT